MLLQKASDIRLSDFAFLFVEMLREVSVVLRTEFRSESDTYHRRDFGNKTCFAMMLSFYFVLISTNRAGICCEVSSYLCRSSIRDNIHDAQ
jgi:hypothetical protein